MKIVIDMNLSPRWAVFLADAGFVAAHWSTLGSGAASDLEIMTFAGQHGFVVLTHDLVVSQFELSPDGGPEGEGSVRVHILDREAPNFIALDTLGSDIADALVMKGGAGLASVDQQLRHGIDAAARNPLDRPHARSLAKKGEDLSALSEWELVHAVHDMNFHA